MSGNAPITTQPQAGTSIGLGLPEAEPFQALNRILQVQCIILRATRGARPQFDILEEREFLRLFRVTQDTDWCSDLGMGVHNLGADREILKLLLDPSSCCLPTNSGTIYFPLGSKFGTVVHLTDWTLEKFQVLDSEENTVFVCEVRPRVSSVIPDFEITRTNSGTIDRATLSRDDRGGEDLTMRWLVEGISSQTKILGLGFLLFLHLRVQGRFYQTYNSIGNDELQLRRNAVYQPHRSTRRLQSYHHPTSILFNSLDARPHGRSSVRFNNATQHPNTTRSIASPNADHFRYSRSHRNPTGGFQ